MGISRAWHKWRLGEAQHKLDRLLPLIETLERIAKREQELPRLEEPNGRTWASRLHEENMNRMELEGRIRYHQAKISR